MTTDSIPKPQPAATVMLLRESSGVMEIFMIVRHEKSDVHGGALVFPGGRVDPEDYELAVDSHVLPPQHGIDAGKGALVVAAVRETFEECGVLLARARGETAIVGAGRLREIEAAHRVALMDGSSTFGTMLAAEDLVLAADTLAYFAHWITPERSAKRFDTHFFVAAAPSDQVALHDGLEAVDSVWIAPAVALERAQAGLYQLRFPTQMNLQKVGRHVRADDALAAARASRVVTVMSKEERRGAGVRVLRVPLEADYGGELFEVLEERSPRGSRR